MPVTRGPRRRAELALYAFCRAVLVGFCRLFFRLRVEGLEHVPRDEPFVLAPVHRSNVDSPAVAALTRRRLRYMGKDTMWKFRLPGLFFTAMGGIPVRRGTPDREALRRCIEAIEGGEPLVLFPEGTRQSGPVVQPLFEGAAYVATRTGAPILPVGIGGSEGAMPKGSKLIRPVRIHLVVGEPIRPPASAPGERTPRRAVRELTDTLHVELQRLLDVALSRAGSGSVS